MIVDECHRSSAAEDSAWRAILDYFSSATQIGLTATPKETEDVSNKAELDNFIDPESSHPVIATTSKLLTTGVDAKTCKLVVLDQRIQSMTEFKQIIGRGTRIDEEHGKLFFTIMDFKKATELFADADFDGDPVQIYEPTGDDDIVPPDDTSNVDPTTGEVQKPDIKPQPSRPKQLLMPSWRAKLKSMPSWQGYRSLALTILMRARMMCIGAMWVT